MRLAASTPRPRINVVLYHGILAPRAKWRAAAVAYGRPDAAAARDDAAVIGRPLAVATPTCPVTPSGAAGGVAGIPAASAAAASVPVATTREPQPGVAEPADMPLTAAPPRRWRWAELLQRVFAVDVLACPSCGGRMRVIATIEDPRVVRRILTHLGLADDGGLAADLSDA